MDIYEARRLAVLQLIAERYGRNQAQFSADTGIAPSYLTRMLKGSGEVGRKRIGTDMAVKIESKLDLEPGALLNAAMRANPEAYQEINELKAREQRNTLGRSLEAGSIDELVPHHTGPRRLVAGKVNLAVMDVRASMGKGAEQPSRENVVMSMVVDETWLRRHANFSHPENLGILTGIGDSMEPTFEDGDPLLIDRAVTDVKLDAVYVLSLNDELYIKRLQRRPNGDITMISDNKSYEPYVIKNAERDQFRVLGRVVMIWNARKI